jgi:hypothetical protein
MELGVPTILVDREERRIATGALCPISNTGSLSTHKQSLRTSESTTDHLWSDGVDIGAYGKASLSVAKDVKITPGVEVR